MKHYKKNLQLLTKNHVYSNEMEHDACGVGLIASTEGKKSRAVVEYGIEALKAVWHRGAVDADGKTGDGAGILIEVPHDYFKKVCEFEIPDFRDYAVGMLFLPKNKNQADLCRTIFEKHAANQDLEILGWRKVPVNHTCLGKMASNVEPAVEQVFIGKKTEMDEQSFNKRLYSARKIAEHEVEHSGLAQSDYFYFSSLSTNTIIYKGLLMPQDINVYYKDLNDRDVITKLALVHQRFSTNTFPTWDLAQPFRYMCHNGEINTLRGNLSRMKAREELFESEDFGDDIKKIIPVILEGKSDSASMDMALELLLQTGRSLPEAIMMMVPEAWEKNPSMENSKKAFYEYNACIMEPWDGPASIPFTDGNYIGALLDRNGLRPARYLMTKDRHVTLASEIGVYDYDQKDVIKKGRLAPGEMLAVDIEKGQLLLTDDIDHILKDRHPYLSWLKKYSAKTPPYNNKEEHPLNFETNELLTYKKAVPFGEHIHLWQAPVYMSGSKSFMFSLICPGTCAPSIIDIIFLSLAMSQIFSTGKINPVENSAEGSDLAFCENRIISEYQKLEDKQLQEMSQDNREQRCRKEPYIGTPQGYTCVKV